MSAGGGSTRSVPCSRFGLVSAGDARLYPILRQRRYCRDHLFGYRMPELQAAGMQADEPHPLIVARGTERPLTAIKLVAQEDVATGSTLDAYLVRAAGFEGNFEERFPQAGQRNV